MQNSPYMKNPRKELNMYINTCNFIQENIHVSKRVTEVTDSCVSWWVQRQLIFQPRTAETPDIALEPRQRDQSESRNFLAVMWGHKNTLCGTPTALGHSARKEHASPQAQNVIRSEDITYITYIRHCKNIFSIRIWDLPLAPGLYKNLQCTGFYFY